ncbi:DegT/DnrJ/EryC1/StrS family aminotransferase [Bradyrhizobium betae]|uniref:DegT/DnrJ/EryC1/StrS family aminotransferase n=1 Tax=Bradyrhizobium betae TaxID=244734 RepID=UPI003D67C921
MAAFLWAQIEDAENITRERLAIWDRYHAMLAPLEQRELLRRPVVPAHCTHNGHLYYVLLPQGTDRDTVIRKLRQAEIQAVFHYVPLHSAPAGMRFGRGHGDLPRTTDLSERLLRLPFWIGLQEAQQQRICDSLGAILGG